MKKLHRGGSNPDGEPLSAGRVEYLEAARQRVRRRRLRRTVIILAGTLCEVGAGRLRAADIPAILASRDRSRAGPTLPAKGLFLKCVDYPEKEEQP